MDGWQYCRLKPKDVLEMTPREFGLVMKAESEHRYDLFEFMSVNALMIRKANLTKPKKKLKTEDFFKRPKDHEIEDSKIIDLQKKIDEQKKFISKFTFRQKEGSEKDGRRKFNS